MKKFILLSFLLLPLIAYASAESVILGWIYALESAQLPNLINLEKLPNIDKLAQDTFDQLKTDLTGKFGHGNLTDSDLRQYQYANDSWANVLKKSDKSSEFTAAQDAYDKLYSTSADIKGVSPLSKTQYQQSRDINRAALAASSYSYDMIAEHLQSVKNILAKLEAKGDITQKEATDLNARLIAESIFVQLEILRQ